MKSYSPLVAAAVMLTVSTSSAAMDRRAFITNHCVDCHNESAKEGGLDLASLTDEVTDRAVFTTWVKIHDRIASGQMPPKDVPRPPEKQTKALLADLQARLVGAEKVWRAESGRVRLRRMTRREFEDTLSDLLALPRLDIQKLLPIDGRVAGYDKIAGGLDISPAHLAAYEEAADKAVSAAIATRSTPPPVAKRRIYPAGLFKFGGNLTHGNFVLLKEMKPDPALPVRGGFEEFKGYISAPNSDADLEERKRLIQENKVAESRSSVGMLVPNLAGWEAAMNVAPIYSGMYRLRLSLWGFQWNQGRAEPIAAAQAAVLRAHEEGKQQEGGRLLSAFTAPSLAPHEQEITTWLDAHESIVFDPVSIPWQGLTVRQIGGRAAKHIGPGVALDWFEFEGPIYPSWPPESHRRLFGNLPIGEFPGDVDVIPPEREVVRGLGGYLPSMYGDLSARDRKPPLETVQSQQPLEDARRLLAEFLPKAFRRPVSPDEVEPYLALTKSRLAAKDCFEDAMRRTYVAVLTSPEFLFHPADDPRDEPAAHEQQAYALASRLSYWLWNGPPDEALLVAAGDDTLRRPEILLKHVDRLLADPRSERFIEDFTNQWLELNRLDETTPDPQLYPEYRFLLHESMTAETRAFLRELIAHDLPIRSLVQPDFAMLSQRLAEHYGISGVTGVEVRRVTLPQDSLRGGLLTQAAVLKVTANGTTTSPVKRGVWVMDRLLNDPAPPPPPGISLIDPDTRGSTTVREQLDRHRSDAACAACHAKIDPAGFALECFDPIGGFRERYRSNGAGDVPPEKGRTVWRVNYKLGPGVDASGELPDGRRFSGIADLNRILADDDETLARAFVAHLSRYATGAEVSFADRAVIRRIVAESAASRYGIRSLIHALAQSELFLSRP